MQREELLYPYDPRCRPWYLASRDDTEHVRITTYPSVDNSTYFVTLSKAIIDRTSSIDTPPTTTNEDASDYLGIVGFDIALDTIEEIL